MGKKAAELKDQLQQTLADLVENAATIRGSDAFRVYLKVAAKFHRYSFGNVVLIAMQHPGATRVAGYRRWQELGRQVRKGQKGIAILAPMPRYGDPKENPDTDALNARTRPAGTDPQDPNDGRVQTGISFKAVHVFDVSQTSGDPLPAEPDWRGKGRDPRLEKALLDYARTLGIETRQYQDGGGPLGWSAGKTIAYTQGGNVPRTIAHELVHQLTPDWRDLDRGTTEALTDAAAAIVCYHFGNDSMVNSATYIAGWTVDPTALLKDLEQVRRVAVSIIDNVEAQLQEEN